MKLREAQSVEQMYTALLLQLETDHDVAHKDLADMEVACNKAEREMLQLQTQLKQLNVQHAAAHEHHHHLAHTLQAVKEEAHRRLARMQHSIMQYSGHAKDQLDVIQSCTVSLSPDFRCGQAYTAPKEPMTR